MKDLNNKPEKDSLSHKAGDALERAGEKISNAGHTKIGNAVSNAGDKLEHMNDNKDKTAGMKNTTDTTFKK